MKQNIASQNIACQMNSRTDGSPLTSSVSAYVTIDGGTQNAGGGTLAHKGNGAWNYIPTQAETNGNHIAFTFVHATGVNCTVQVYTTFPQTGDGFARLGAPAGASVSADILVLDNLVDDLETDTNDIQGRLPAALTANGNMKSSVLEFLTTALTETAGQITAAFKKFFDVAAPTGTVNSLPDAVPGAANALLRAGTNTPVTITGSGTALTLTSTGANGHGLVATGEGTGDGIRGNGGTTSGSGLRADGGGSGSGVYGRSGATSGAGIKGEGVATNSTGLSGVGAGTGHGIYGSGGSTSGSGIYAVGGGWAGIGAVGSSTQPGILATGGATSGMGIKAQGTGSGVGISAAGGTTSGAGILATGGANHADADGIRAVAGGALASDIQGNITGDLSGSVGSVTGLTASDVGAIKTKTDNLPTDPADESLVIAATDAIAAAVAALNNLSAAQVNAEVVDALAVDTYVEPGQGAPGATISIAAKLNYLFKAWRNRHTQTAAEYALYADNATTKDQKAAVSDDATTFDRGEIGTGA